MKTKVILIRICLPGAVLVLVATNEAQPAAQIIAGNEDTFLKNLSTYCL